MGLYDQVLHTLEGEEIYHDLVTDKDGTRRVERKSWGTDRWIERAHKRGVLTGVELLAVILFVVDDIDIFRPVDEREKIVNQWAEAISEAVKLGDIVARDRDSYLPLKSNPDGWDWVLALDVADAFVASSGMDWTCTQIVEHLHNETYPDTKKQSAPLSADWGKHTTNEIKILRKAILEFWENHDLNKPPKKLEVVAWLKKEGISQGVAESMDTMMRTARARKGGNKRVPPITTNK